MKGVCKKCGCTDNNACVSTDGWTCYWVDFEEDLCSFCATESNSDVDILA